MTFVISTELLTLVISTERSEWKNLLTKQILTVFIYTVN